MINSIFFFCVISLFQIERVIIVYTPSDDWMNMAYVIKSNNEVLVKGEFMEAKLIQFPS